MAALKFEENGDGVLMKRSRIFAVLAVVLCSVLFCGAAMAKDTLIVADQYDPTTMDPVGHNDMPSSRACFELYDTLVFMGPDGKLVPGLAEKWEFPSPTEYKFYLRKGVKFHNGDEMKAEDVQYTIMRATTDKGAKIKSYSENVKDVKVIDDYTVVVYLKNPDFSFFSSLTHSWGSIVNKKVAKDCDDTGKVFEPVGTGPFKFVSWNKNDKYVLERFDDYWGKKAAYKFLEVRSVPEPTARTVQLEAGDIDIAFPIVTNDIRRIEENESLALYRGPQTSITYMGFNTVKPPFNDVRVRRAIDAALDTVRIQKAVWRGVGVTPTSMVPVAIKYSIANEVPAHKQDTELAKKLLAEAGIKPGTKFEIWTNERKERQDMATIIQAQLKKIGIETEIKVLEWGAYLNGLQEKKHDMFLLGWVSTVPDPNFALAGLLGTNAGSNYTFFSNKEFDDLLAEGRMTPDGDARKEIYRKAQILLNDQCPMVYLHNDESIAGAQKHVKGFAPSTNEVHSFRDVYFE